MSDSNGRDATGRFTEGNAGGPGGARRRSSELRRAAEEAITPEHVTDRAKHFDGFGSDIHADPVTRDDGDTHDQRSAVSICARWSLPLKST